MESLEELLDFLIIMFCTAFGVFGVIAAAVALGYPPGDPISALVCFILGMVFFVIAGLFANTVAKR